MKKNTYLKIAYWYYTLGLTQDEIARRLSLSRQKVNQIISSLVDLGIVTISVNGYEREFSDLERSLEDRYGLTEAIIVDDFDDPDNAIHSVASTAALYLNETVTKGMNIGVSWGSALAEMVKEMTYHKKAGCCVVPMMGVQNMDQRIEKTDEIARNMANKLDCHSYMLYAPVLVDRAETKKWLMQERTIIAAYERMKQCDIAFLGIGELTETATMCTRGVLSKEEVRRLREDGFVADISMNPIRADGSWDNCYLTDRLINANIPMLKDINNTVAVVSGIRKTEAIRACLKTGCINTLIVDETTARHVLELPAVRPAE